MRKLAVAMVLLVAALLGSTSVSGRDLGARVSIGRQMSVELPHGWRVIRRGRQSNHPSVLASFPVTFSRHPCPCAHPNYRTCGAWCHETGIRAFPAAGALVYIWEFPVPRNPAELGRGFVPRPAAFHVTEKNPRFGETLARELRKTHRQAGHACVEGPGSLPSWWSDFLAARRAFQVEVYLGPQAGPDVRARVDELLDSLRISALRQRVDSAGRPMTLAQFASLRHGESRGAVLRAFGSPESRRRVVRYGFTHEEPRGLRCMYYRRRFPDAGAPWSRSDTFQLCFAGSRLRHRWAYVAARA
jgi:hypothetical protein